MKIVCVTFLEILLQIIFGESGDEEEENLMSIRWRYFLFVYSFLFVLFLWQWFSIKAFQ